MGECGGGPGVCARMWLGGGDLRAAVVEALTGEPLVAPGDWHKPMTSSVTIAIRSRRFEDANRLMEYA